jgi:uncharacterized repeat protein (TIGR01451 family)
MKWFLGIFLLLLCALLLESGLLAYAAYVLVGLLVLSRFLARNWIGKLQAARQATRSTAEIGKTVTITISLRNEGWLPIPWVLLEDLLPRRALAPDNPRLRVKGKRLQLRMLWARGEATLEYRLKLQMRGYYQIGPLIMESGDLFGLHRRYRVATEPHFLLVYPRVIPLEGYDLASRRPIGEVRLSHRLYEDPTRISGVREYQAGDSLNRIHWGATARTGMLHSKVYEPSTLAGAMLVLDFHQAGYGKRGEPHRSELAVTAAVSLAHAVYLMGQQVGLISNGRDAADRIRTEGWEHDYRTRTAVRQSTGMSEKNERLQPLVVESSREVEGFQHIHETLARIELTDGLTFGELIVETAHRLPRDATVVAVLPAVPMATALALGNLKRRGFAVTAILILIDDEELEQAYGRLLAEGIRDVRHLKSEAGLSNLCQEQVRHPTPYAMATTFD